MNHPVVKDLIGDEWAEVWSLGDDRYDVQFRGVKAEEDVSWAQAMALLRSLRPV